MDGIIVRISSAITITGRASMAGIATVGTTADIIMAAIAVDAERGGRGPLDLSYSAASTAFVTSAVPLLPPNSIGLMPSA